MSVKLLLIIFYVVVCTMLFFNHMAKKSIQKRLNK